MYQDAAYHAYADRPPRDWRLPNRGPTGIRPAMPESWFVGSRRHLRTIVVFLAGLALANQSVTTRDESSYDGSELHDIKGSLHVALSEFQRLVEKTIDIRIQRDALLVNSIRVSRGKSTTVSVGHPSLGWADTDAFDNARTHPRNAAHSGPANPDAFAPGADPVTLTGLKSATVKKARQLIAAAGAEGIELKVLAGHPDIYGRPMKPRSKPMRHISPHAMGLAFDVAVVRDGRIDAGPSVELARVGVIGRDLGLIWGGDFSRHQSWSHFELPSLQKDFSALRGDTSSRSQYIRNWGHRLSLGKTGTSRPVEPGVL